MPRYGRSIPEEDRRQEEETKARLRLIAAGEECRRSGCHDGKRESGHHVCEKCFTSEEHDFRVYHVCRVCGYSPDAD